MIKRLGLMAGTFDPPHIGHLIMAESGFDALSLDHVLFLPVGQPTHKSTLTAAKHRMRMTELAISGNRRFSIDLTDINRPSPHYTATLLPLLKERYPAAELWLLIGEDSLINLINWHQPDTILSFCFLGVSKRPGYTASMDAIHERLPQTTSQIAWIDGPSIDLSSTAIRQAVKDGRSINYLVPQSVLNYIDKNGLYA